MPIRRVRRVRLLLALGLALAVLPLVSVPSSGAVSPAPAPATPAGCCPQTSLPSCPSCPTDGRSSCPTTPSRARTCCSWQALPPAGPAEERRERPSEDLAGGETRSPSAGTARVASAARRASVQEASPPLQLLVRSFRN